MSREQFEQIQALLENVRKRTKPRSMDLYEICCAVLSLLKTGCQWRLLPNDVPRWQTVYRYFKQWSEPDQNGVSILDAGTQKIRLARPV